MISSGASEWDVSVADWLGPPQTFKSQLHEQAAKTPSRWLLAVGGTRRYLQLSACQAGFKLVELFALSLPLHMWEKPSFGAPGPRQTTRRSCERHRHFSV